MRPRPIGRGDAWDAGNLTAVAESFNEAPANWPGRSAENAGYTGKYIRLQ